MASSPKKSATKKTSSAIGTYEKKRQSAGVAQYGMPQQTFGAQVEVREVQRPAGGSPVRDNVVVRHSYHGRDTEVGSDNIYRNHDLENKVNAI
jgi:hypothetical protein